MHPLVDELTLSRYLTHGTSVLSSSLYSVAFFLFFFSPISFFCFCPNRKWVSLPFIGMDILEALCFYREGKIRNIFEIGGLLLQSFYNSILNFAIWKQYSLPKKELLLYV
ncbi:CIH_HP2_G0052400.mRNA.1.CDS.1 [Saccharomyces cerevisiae]|nr:hypothetical protein WN66_06421 [Saccharomyces cerevisiae]CAI4903809.1 CHS_3a_G0054380.mRNA.1.CDS.1 [Saccharomyces cerevisiae]CAI5320720.1 CIH_HP2_G0052400.mRNA.1.CDS.1 [Saccharomyces cerevisiae]CAI6734239.1 CIH_HP2_G0052400.mRNA.1.CDS.1 [Saccharomyces cerevisiae]CAI6785485.1 CIH_HP1_G0053670.mRNA.1.CDS.1 [Saccharomyces cerevisiae]